MNTKRFMVYNDGISIRAFATKAEADAYAAQLSDYHRATFTVAAV